MSEEENVFKHPVTGEILPDKRNNTQSQKIETILAKVALSQEMTESTIRNMEKVQTTSNKMLENLIKSECESLRTELKTHNDNNIRDYNQIVTTQKTFNIGVSEEFKKVNENIKKHEDRIVVLENKTTKKKAAVFDKVAIALGGALLTLIATNFISILKGIASWFH